MQLSSHNRKTNFEEMKIPFSVVKSTPLAAAFKCHSPNNQIITLQTVELMCGLHMCQTTGWHPRAVISTFQNIQKQAHKVIRTYLQTGK